MPGTRKYQRSGRYQRWLAAGALLLFVTGCQQRPTTVTGVVTLDGKSLTVGSDSRGTVIFQPVGGSGTTVTGLLDPTGHFKLATGASEQIAAGKYQVAVSVVQLLPASDQAEQGGKRITPAKYASSNTSGLEAEVKAGENDFVFDLRSSDNDTTPDVPNATVAPQPAPAAATPQKLQQ